MLALLLIDTCLAKEAEYLDGTFKDANQLWKVESSLAFIT
jgi:hypothetical protein